MHPSLHAQPAPHRAERLVALREVDAGAAVAQVFEPRPTFGPRPERLADRVVLPRLVWLHLGQPLPRLADAARHQDLRDRERAVTHQALADVVTRMQDRDAADLGLRPIGLAVPEEIPHLFRRRVHHDRVLVTVHDQILSQRCRSTSLASLRRPFPTDCVTGFVVPFDSSATPRTVSPFRTSATFTSATALSPSCRTGCAFGVADKSFNS